MGFFSNIFGSYDAAEDTTKRRNPVRRKVLEDRVLKQSRRDRVGATGWDLLRNDPVVAWAFGKFLDYGTVAYFASRSGNFEFDDALEQAVANWSRPANCDAAKRNGFDELIRIFGGCLLMDGDAGMLKIMGGRLQGIESDRIRESGTGSQAGVPESVNGVIVEPESGAALGYLLFDRVGSGYEFNRILAPEHLIFRGNFVRFDQFRGIPLIVPAITKFQDSSETDEYQQIKVKNHAALAVAVTSQTGSGLNGFGGAPLGGGLGEAGDGEDDEEHAGIYSYDLTNPGVKIELDPNDKIDTIESHTPSNEYQSFAEMQLRKALLVFGLSFSFFDSSRSSYSAMKQDRAEFKFFIARFQRTMIELRNEITEWVLPQIMAENGLEIPDGARLDWEWMPQAEPWLDESAEVGAAEKRVADGFSSVEFECRRRGHDAYDLARQTARYQQYVRKAGIVVSVGAPGAALFNSQNLSSTSAADAAPGASPFSPGAAVGEDVKEQPEESSNE